MISEYRDSKVLITGGLGFIGSNLALRLAQAGAHVTVVDASVEGCGGNPYNLSGSEAAVRVIHADIAHPADFAPEIRAASIVFNIAGEVSHIGSMENPDRDAQLNAIAHLHFLEACACAAPGVRIVYASTRQIYGAPRYLPVDENHPVQPVDFNGIHKYAATAYHLINSSAGKIDGRVLCLSNVYGPRMALHLPKQGFLGGFLRKALLGEAVEIFGEGRQLRDPVYVDDVVNAFLLAGAVRNPKSRLWNVGGAEALPIAAIGNIICSEAGAPAPVFTKFPDDRKRIDIGSYRSDSSRIQAELGWRAHADFESGIRRTLKFFRQHLPHYIHVAKYVPSSPADSWTAPQPLAI